MTTPDVAELARGLTEAQRAAILYPSGYHDPNTIRSLRRRGLRVGGLLTEAGAMLRAYLSQPPKTIGED